MRHAFQCNMRQQLSSHRATGTSRALPKWATDSATPLLLSSRHRAWSLLNISCTISRRAHAPRLNAAPLPDYPCSHACHRNSRRMPTLAVLQVITGGGSSATDPRPPVSIVSRNVNAADCQCHAAYLQKGGVLGFL